MKNLNLYLIRHGQTEWNLAGRMQGIKNSDLTESGVNGAKITGEHLKSVNFISAYSSDLKRASETLDYILDVNLHNQSISRHTMQLLREMDFGLWEGASVSELKKTGSFMHFINQPALFDAKKNKGETYYEALMRTKNAINKIVTKTQETEGNILIVCHGMILRLLLNDLSGGVVAEHRDDRKFPNILNTSISIVNYSKKEQAEQYNILSLNDVTHLKSTEHNYLK